MKNNKLSSSLIRWNAEQPVHYPWVHEKDPYKVLLSEFLLQQTRSDQALPYYRRLLKTFPTIQVLASASEDQLLRLWQGLGYYSRARNLHRTAKIISSEYNGQVPDTYKGLIALPGIGPYTAAAIASFAFGESRPVVDGNVFRVLSRLLAIDTPVNTPNAKSVFTEAAGDIMGQAKPAAFNQAIMNLGARVCTPKTPACSACPWQSDCRAHEEGTISLFPIKQPKRALRDRYFHFFDIRLRSKTLIEKRVERDIWQGLYQFPLLERKSTRRLSQTAATAFLQDSVGLTHVDIVQASTTFKQILSHQRIHARFYIVHARQGQKSGLDNFTLVFRKNLENFALPRTITRYLNSEDK